MSDDGNSDAKLARIETLLSTLTQQVAELSILLLGKDGNPGIVVRLDRVEQAEHKRSRFVWVAIGVAVASLAKSLLP